MKLRIFFPAFVFVIFSGCQNSPSKYIFNKGMVYGTYYSIKYESPDGTDLQQEINSELKKYKLIFSHYERESTISKINYNEDVEPEPEFISCFEKALEISEITNGAFDITAGPLVNAWGFGPEDRKKMTQEKVDSLLEFTGYQKIKLVEGKILKNFPEMKLDMSAIAKGYTCDLMGKFLSEKGCENYMVDIGGEVVAKGKNDRGKVWTIGIREPIEDPLRNDLNAVLRLPDMAMATSGNYMNFYEEDGKKFAHTIDPKTGYPVQHSLLSATVLAVDCITADAYATAFMVLGMDLGIEIARQVPGLEIYFIYADEKGENRVYVSEGFEKFLVN